MIINYPIDFLKNDFFTKQIGLKLPFHIPSQQNVLKRAARCSKPPAHIGSEKGFHHFGVLYAILPCFLHKRLFPGLEPVTFKSRDNNFTVAPRAPLIIPNLINIPLI